MIRAAALGLWAFTNLELAYALLRVEERARAFAIASLINVALTVALTRLARRRAATRARSACCSATTSPRRSCCSACGGSSATRSASAGGSTRAQLGPMLRFGLPTVPAEVSVFALFFVDRLLAVPLRERRTRRACTRSRSSSPASSSSPCARSSTRGRRSPTRSRTTPRRRRVYARITTYYVLFTGLVVAGPGAARPLARAAVRRAASSSRRTRRCPGSRSAGRSTACSWCWWRWPGRAQVTVRNAPAALCGPGRQRRAARAARRRRWGSPAPASRSSGAYVVMLVVM